MAINKGLFSSNTDEWETPQSFFDEWNQQFHFTLDACANKNNHKVDRYFSKEENGLEKDWGGDCLVQSSVWKEHRAVGQKMLVGGAKERYEGRCTSSSKDGHKMVSRICVLRGTYLLCERAAQIWRFKK